MSTPPRRIRPNMVYEISRRTVSSEFRLVADPVVEQLFRYLLAEYSNLYGVEVISATVMLNHYHLQLLDRLGLLPLFVQTFDSVMARALNCYHGTQGTFWCGNGYTPLEPMTEQAQLERLDYIIENPLAANLVRRLHDYPHVRVRPDDILEPQIIERPKFFFSERTALPERVTLRYTKLPALAHLSDEEYSREIARRIKVAEDKHIERRRVTGESVCGAKRLRRIRWDEKPNKRREWFKRRPQLATRDRAARMHAIAELRQFRARYREALRAWRAGEKKVRFPYGTWKMRRDFGALVEPVPT